MVAKSLMRSELEESSDVVARLLDREAQTFATIARLLRERRTTLVTTAARGSSDHAATFFKYLLEITAGLPVASIGPSVASVYHAPLKLDGAVHFTVSQSGASPDIVALQKAARQGGAVTVAVVNVADSALAHGADIVLGLHAGPERSVAATKSCLAAAVALAGVAAEVSGDQNLSASLRRLPEVLSHASGDSDEEVAQFVAKASSLFVSGRGTGFAVALEAALKAKETSAIHAEAFSLAELMHGPMRLVEDDFPIVAFLPRDAAYDSSVKALAHLSALGGKIVTIGASGAAGRNVDVPSTGNGLLDPLAGLLVWYGLVERVARISGFDPDRPKNLKKVTETV